MASRKNPGRILKDAIHHSSLLLIRTLKIDKATVHVDVTIGVQQPGRVDVKAAQAALPVGYVSVKVARK